MLYKGVAALAHICAAFPELLPVTGFHPAHMLHTYSGGTVRESHPIILFSKQSHTLCLPRNWYLVVEGIVAQQNTGVNPHPLPAPTTANSNLSVSLVGAPILAPSDEGAVTEGDWGREIR